MLVSKRSVGLGKRGSVFSNKRILSTPIDSPSQWVLKNSKVEFTFISDCMTGVRLDSFHQRPNGKVWDTNTRILWALNILQNVDRHPHQPTSVIYDYYAIYPTKETFQNVSVVPVVSPGGKKSFTFTWKDVQYNKNDTQKVCDVILTASLGVNDTALDISLRLETNQSILSESTKDVCISTVCFPKFAFKNISEEEDKTKVFSIPVGLGHSVKWPNKYLRTPRFDLESFQASNLYNRTYHSGQTLNIFPKINIRRHNVGSPGDMSIPCAIWGDSEEKEGILIYAMDPDGIHAKGWQWYSDDKNLILKVYDVSDHEIDYYGLGGKNSSTSKSAGWFGNKVNQIGWTLRIRPFSSPTRWVAWYGYSLYKSEVTPTLESSWMPKSFYEQYKSKQLDLRDIEIPYVITTIGPMYAGANETGLLNAVDYWKNVYKNITNPVRTDDVRMNLMYSYVTTFITGTNGLDYRNNYPSWESFAGALTGTNVGPTGFKTPDYYPVNPSHSGLFKHFAEKNVTAFPYLLNSYYISSYSNYAKSISGYDLISKTLIDHDKTYLSGDYISYAANPVGLGAQFNNSFAACHAVTSNYDQFVRIGSDLGKHGVGAYHDTFGGWGRGCYADSHKYRKGTKETIEEHPRGAFTHYFMSQEENWISGFSNALSSNTPSFVDKTGTKKLAIAQCSESHCDTNLKYVPNTIYYESQTIISTAIFGVALDGISGRTDIIYTAGGPPVFSVSSEAPDWLERAPGYPIVYGDRTIFNWFNMPVMHDGLDASGFYFTAGKFSGLNPTTYASVHYPNTHPDRVLDMQAWAAMDYGYLRRFSIAHGFKEALDHGFGVGAVSLSGAVQTEDYQVQLENNWWSGYYNHIKQYIRLSAYEPDYLYHGTLQHPLDDWTVSRTTDHRFSRYTRKSRTPTLFDPDEFNPGDDKVIHHIYQKRNSTNLMVQMINWYSGNVGFTGTFDPLTYDITKSYQVYSLDVSTASHGTKTFLDFVPARHSYSITKTIPSGQFYVLEIVPLSNISSLETFANFTASYVNVRYRYNNTELTTNSVGVVYSYGSSIYEEPTERNIGYLAPATQQIVNNLPQWMAIRQKTDSVGWMFVNSWGQNLEDILQDYKKKSYNIWLETADTLQRNKINKSDINDVDTASIRTITNQLFNSNFLINDVARSKLPAGWYDYGKSTDTNYAQLDNYSIITTKSIKLVGQISVAQTITLQNEKLENIIASAYLNSNSEFVDVQLSVVLQYTDGTIGNYYAILNSRSEEWRRLVLPVTKVNKQVSTIKYIISSLDANTEVYISAPQLEFAPTVSSWSRSLADTTPIVSYSNRFNLVQAINSNNNTKIGIYGLTTEKDFLTINIPTRIEKSNIPIEDLEGYAETSFGRKVDFFNQIYDTNWNVENGYIVERSSSGSQFDIFNKYTIRDLRFYTRDLYGTRNDNITRTIIAGAIRDGLMYVLTQEIDTTYKIFYTLKILVPKPPASRASYLESIADFELNLNLDTIYGENQLSEVITSIGFSDKYPEYLILNTSMAKRLFYRMYFDYYYFDSNTNQLYTIENYNGAKIKIV